MQLISLSFLLCLQRLARKEILKSSYVMTSWVVCSKELTLCHRATDWSSQSQPHGLSTKGS